MIVRHDKNAVVDHSYIPKSIAEKAAEEDLIKKGKTDVDKENVFTQLSPPPEIILDER